MRLLRYNFLFHKDLSAHGAVLSFCQTGFGTGCFLRRIDYFRMCLLLHHFLFHKDLSTHGAVLSFCQAGFCAGRFLRRVDYFRMRHHRNLFIGGVIAALTGLISFPAYLCTGRFFSFMLYQVMAQRFSEGERLCSNRSALAAVIIYRRLCAGCLTLQVLFVCILLVEHTLMCLYGRVLERSDIHNRHSGNVIIEEILCQWQRRFVLFLIVILAVYHHTLANGRALLRQLDSLELAQVKSSRRRLHAAACFRAHRHTGSLAAFQLFYLISCEITSSKKRLHRLGRHESIQVLKYCVQFFLAVQRDVVFQDHC